MLRYHHSVIEVCRGRGRHYRLISLRRYKENEAVCSSMKQKDGDAEMIMLQSVFLISPGVFIHSRSPQSLSKFVKSETPILLEYVNRFVSQIRKKIEMHKNQSAKKTSEAENGVLLPAACVEVSRLILPVLMERRRGVLPRGEIGVGGGGRERGGHWRSHLCN